MSSPSGLELRGLVKRFGDTVAVDGVSLSVPRGRQTVLLGPSGCGKTTLLRIIAGLEREDAGTVAIDGARLSDSGRGLPPEKRRIGMVFQDWALFPHMTVARNVAFGLTRRQVLDGAVDRTLGMMDMAGLAHRRPHELSAGQAQRVALARALAPQPRLLLFDEPFSSLDAELRVKVRGEVAALMRELQMTAVYVTHDQEEAFILGDEVAVMRDGRLVQVGTPAAIYADPATRWVARFLGDANLLRGFADGSSAVTGIGTMPLVQDRHGECEVLARPEHIAITPGASAMVRAVEFYGHDTVYRLVVGEAPAAPTVSAAPQAGEGASSPNPTIDEVLVRAAAAPAHRVGDRVSLSYVGPAAVSYAC
jgi:iron(III) transport system ATP-binding protein